MKKKLTVLLTVFILMFMFVGCQKIELSEEDEKLFIAYVVDSVLKYDYDYADKLVDVPAYTVDENQTKPNGEPVTTVPNEDNDNQGNNSSGDSSGELSGIVEVPLTNLIGAEGFEVNVTDYVITDKYSEEGTDMAVSAADGKKLLIINVGAKNVTDKPANLNIIGKDIKFTAVVNDTKKMNPQIWVWSDGCTFNVFESDFEPGETIKSILIFQVNKDIDMNSIKLLVSNGSEEGYITVK
ncbi:MAG: hypothetical protein E7266_09170 [Lachnospiraceae bacterium]|nr:hypothetical protein [Lachnospiraceae bacterium]